MTEAIVIFCTVPAKDTGLQIARNLVSRSLAACANCVPGLVSVFQWEDKICENDEFLLVIKTRRELFGSVSEAIGHMHPHDVPEIISFPVEQGSNPYLDWIARSTPAI